MTLLAFITHAAVLAVGIFLRELWEFVVKPLLLALINRI